MNLQQVEERIRADYRQATAQYRRDDEIEIKTANHRRLCGLLGRICSSFQRPITVLDVGCGTGRYFHCLDNVEHLTGLDVSEDMLAAAAEPVLKEEITARQITLLRGNAYLADFAPRSFDFIYSLGMFGHGSPVTAQICDNFYRWLKPSGKLLFNVVDVAGLPWCYRTRRRLKAFIYPLLTKHMRRSLDERAQRSPFFALTKLELLRVMAHTKFAEFSVASHGCESPLWNGRHLECLAAKQQSRHRESPLAAPNLQNTRN
jgi:SAM-dependent methyltransferase